MEVRIREHRRKGKEEIVSGGSLGVFEIEKDKLKDNQ